MVADVNFVHHCIPRASIRGVMFVEGMNKSRPVDVDGELEAWKGQSDYGPSSSPDPLTFWERQVCSVLTGSVTLLQKMASRNVAATGGVR